MLGETNYKLLKQKTDECNKLIHKISLVPHQIRLVENWETKSAFDIIHSIITFLSIELPNN